MSVSLVDYCCPIEYSPWKKKDLPDDISPLGELEQRWEIIDSRTERHYRGASPQQISIISLLLIAYLPIYAIARMIFSLAKTIARIVKTAYEIFSAIWNGKDSETEKLSQKAFLLLQHGYRGIWEIAAAPFYVVGLFFSAALGVFIPYEGRKYFAMIENHWHSGASYRNDVRRVHSQENPFTAIFWKSLIDPEAPYVFYLAYCFQPLERGDA